MSQYRLCVCLAIWVCFSYNSPFVHYRFVQIAFEYQKKNYSKSLTHKLCYYASFTLSHASHEPDQKSISLFFQPLSHPVCSLYARLYGFFSLFLSIRKPAPKHNLFREIQYIKNGIKARFTHWLCDCCCCSWYRFWYNFHWIPHEKQFTHRISDGKSRDFTVWPYNLFSILFTSINRLFLCVFFLSEDFFLSF